jgi:hypothetical protein
MTRYIRTIAMIALFKAGLANAREYVETNAMPAEIHALMETEGYVINQKLLSNSAQNTNSLGNFVALERPRSDLFELITKKKDWSIWNNTKIKFLHRNTETSAISLTQFEYDISYPFYF